MGFKTKLDYSNNRQIKQYLETQTALSGGTIFGTPFANLTKGPNLNTSGETENYDMVTSTFSGNNTTSIFSWYDSRMQLGYPQISAITPTTSAETQTILPVFQPSESITIDGNVVNTSFTGVTFNLYTLSIDTLGGGNYSGIVESTYFDILSASTAEFTGRTIWVDVSGITRTDRLIVNNNPTIGNVLTCIDSEGMASWEPAGGGGSGATSYWSAGTGTNAIVTINAGNLANGNYAVAEGNGTQASGNYSHSEGLNTISFGRNSHTEGNGTQAIGDYSHAEGNFSFAQGQVSHAEGSNTTASGTYSHSEGENTIASGVSSHAQGRFTQANGNYSHAGGNNTRANGDFSFVHGENSRANGNNSIVLGKNITGSTADTTYVDSLNIKSIPTGIPINNLGIDATGRVIVGTTGGGGGGTNYWSAGTGTNAIATINGNNIASGDYSIAEGNGTIANGFVSHTEGGGTQTFVSFSHAEGDSTIASGRAAHAEGFLSKALNDYSHAEGNLTIANGIASHAEGRLTNANGIYSHSEGSGTTANGQYSHAEGQGTIASGPSSHAEGWFSEAIGDYSHAENYNTISSGFSSHAEGVETIAGGQASHAEGRNTQAMGDSSHAEGSNTQAIGGFSHAEGSNTQAIGNYSHAGGEASIANGQRSFVHGLNSVANADNTIVLGASITGSTANTTYVDNLNIKTVGSSPSVNDIRIDATGNLTTNTSDIRFKENISRIENSLDKINKLEGVKFQWKDRLSGGDDFKIGFIAQEVEKVEPLLVFTNKNDGYKGIHIDGIIPLLVEAIKELSTGVTTYQNTHLETQTIFVEDNNIELNYNGTKESSIDGGITILRGENEENTSIILNENGDWVSNVNILSKGFVIPEYTPTSTKDTSGIVGNIVQDDNYIYLKRENGWKRTPKLEEF